MREINPTPRSPSFNLCPLSFSPHSPRVHSFPFSSLIHLMSSSHFLICLKKSLFHHLFFPSSLQSHADLDDLMRRVSPTWSDVLQTPCTHEHAGTETLTYKHKYHVLEDYGSCILGLQHAPIFLNIIAFWKKLLVLLIYLSLYPRCIYL